MNRSSGSSDRRLRIRTPGGLCAIASLSVSLTLVAGCAQTRLFDADAAANAPAPEAASGYQLRARVTGRASIVATANPLASAAARRVLQAGGSAADAAIAAQWVLSLVEPQSSGLGGGAVLLYHDAASGRTQAIDGRETAPAAVDETLFLGADGKPLGYEGAVVGGRAVGTPGAVAAMALLHQRHGRLPWARLFDEAITLAEDGFAVGARLNRLATRDPFLRRDPSAAAYFYDPQGKPWPVGHRLRNPQLAATLRAIAQQGPQAFYRGPIASAIAAKVAGVPGNPGRLDEQDIARYTAIVREPVCAPWLRYVVCSMPPPSSGGIAILQMLGMLESLARERGPVRLFQADRYEAQGVHRFVETARLAFADRARYVADPQFAPWPEGLLDPQYLQRRAALIDDARSMQRATAGEPPGSRIGAADGVDVAPESGTSHWSIADAAGNVVAVTSSIESAFGSRQMVGGFLLNNQLTDFSFVPDGGGRSAVNRVQGGKRPRSSMAPTLVFERRADGSAGRWVMSVGSSGGPQIINDVARVLVATLADGIDLQTAIALPNFGSRNGPTEIEHGVGTGVDAVARLTDALRRLGHELRNDEITSGLHGIARRCERADTASCTLTGGADPRREGLVLAD